MLPKYTPCICVYVCVYLCLFGHAHQVAVEANSHLSGPTAISAYCQEANKRKSAALAAHVVVGAVVAAAAS